MDESSAQIFREVAQHHSLRGAAKALYMSEPAIGARMRQLEADLGITLFERSPRGIELTGEGKVLLELIDRFLHMCADIRQSLRPSNEDSVPKFNIGATPALSSYRLAPVLARISLAPSYEVSVTACSQEEVIFGVLSRKFHAGLVSSATSSKNLKVVELFTDPLLFVTSYQNADARSRISVEEIRSLRILCPGPPYRTWNILEDYFARHQVWPRHITFVNNRDTIKKALVNSSNLYGFVPQSALIEESALWNMLQNITIEPREGLSVSEYLIWRQGYFTDINRHMLNLLMQALSSSITTPSSHIL